MIDADRLAREAIAAMPGVSVLVFDRDFRFRAVLGAAVREHGHDPDLLVGRCAPDVLPAGVWEQLAPLYRSVIDGETLTEEIRSRDGSRVYETTFSPIPGPEGPIGGMAVARDISERKRGEEERRRGEEQLARAKEMLEVAFISAPIATALVDPDGRWLRVNPALCGLVGRRAVDLTGGSLADITHRSDRGVDSRLLRETLDGGRDRYRVEKRLVHADGRTIWVSLSASLVRRPDRSARWFVLQFEDVTERKRLEERLRHEASHDSLTGLWNRARVREELQRCLAEHDRYGQPAALMLIDLDGLKLINDRFGHAAGDQHLGEVAQAIDRAVRESDFSGRLGGDEFAVLLPHADAGEARLVAGRVVEAIRAVGSTGERRGLSTASVGIAELVRGSDLDDWLGRADRAMYRAKRAGGDRALIDGETADRDRI